MFHREEKRKVKIKPLNLENVGIHHKWNNDKELSYYDSEYPHKREDFETFLKRLKAVINSPKGSTELLEIFAGPDDVLIGIVDIHAIDRYNMRCFVNCTIGRKEYRGIGYGTEVMKSVLAYCFKELNMQKVATTSFDFNNSWMHLVEKLGMKKEGELRKHVLKKGEFHNKLIFSILADEYRNMPYVKHGKKLVEV